MAIKLPIQFPIFAPPPKPLPRPNPNPILSPNPNGPHHLLTVTRFSRWYNANAEKFNQRQRAQKEIEDDIRRHRRFDSATRITTNFESDINPAAVAATQTFKSIGTPSSPSRPSIPGKKSKYSKSPDTEPHPAFRRVSRTGKRASEPKYKSINKQEANIAIGPDGVSYVIDGAPFEFKYSYTETPKVNPLKLREPYAPFGPTTMARPWTGRAPLPPSKKKLKEFDSFVLPPPDKKGVKPVQKPGPFLEGSGPRYVYSREEILGEPLTKEEVMELVNGCMKSQRQLNMGRDGLTHNMLDNIHAHWKRRRVCKVKCKGVCTVDMENVCQQLEERTGGKIIHRKGGVLYLFRGRNYNYKTRPRFPLMLWKPAAPVYPRLIERVPEGLTLEEATEMRKKGRKLIPICKLGKNGVYCDLVKNVREAFEECELVRINCQGMNKSDYRKIGAKLKDLVPCVLISFEYEHILIWRGRDWKSSLPALINNSEGDKVSNIESANSVAAQFDGEKLSASFTNIVSDINASLDSLNSFSAPVSSENTLTEEEENLFSLGNKKPYAATVVISTDEETLESEATSDMESFSDDESEAMVNNFESVSISDDTEFTSDKSVTTGNINCRSEVMLDDKVHATEEPTAILMGSDSIPGKIETTGNCLESSLGDSVNHDDKGQDVSEESQNLTEPERPSVPTIQRVLFLMKQAIENGSAVLLDDFTSDADSIYQRAVAFAQTAPLGPVFRHRPRKVAVQKVQKMQESENLEVREIAINSKNNSSERQTPKMQKKKNLDGRRLGVVLQGSLGVDELAKLLA